ncbi:MAG: hypothetical protein FWF47_04090 [Clostridia bacterium]|nr:hypothetical protein [Clostridia bacterium]
MLVYRVDGDRLKLMLSSTGTHVTYTGNKN